MGVYENMIDIVKALKKDEELLRLLVYPPKDVVNGIPDPLSPTLPNILDRDPLELTLLKDKHIMKSNKSDDFDSEDLVRIYVYAGRRRPQLNTYSASTQEVIFDIFAHYKYEEDFRINRVRDRLEKLMSHEYITGMGRFIYNGGDRRPAPENYRAYYDSYSFGSSVK